MCIRDRYRNIVLNGDNPYQWLEQFPLLTKEIIRNEPHTLISEKENTENLIPYFSSGSSGVQSKIYMNRKEQSLIRGVLTHWWEWSGYRLGKGIAQTGMSANRSYLKKIKDKLFKTLYLEAFSLSEEQLSTFFQQMKKRKIKYLVGYASSLNVIAEYAIKNEVNIKLKSVISLGDKLFNTYRKNLKQAFSADIYDTYGSNEGLMIAATKEPDIYYILSPHVYIEILNDQGTKVKDGEIGNIVATRLDAFSMPLIRYKLGDLGSLLPKDEYPEKRTFNYPILKQIIGRDTDVVILKDDKKLIVHSFTGIFEYFDDVKQFKVIQSSREGITIEYLKGKGFEQASLKKIEFELQKYIQDTSFKIVFKEVDYIAPTKSGKPQIIESRIKK